MANAASLSGVRKWLEREEWREPFDRLLEMHLEAPCKSAGIEIEQLAGLIGEGHAANLFGCVFEDMLARELEDGSNIVDDYLKRRGWKEPVPNKRYMMALRSSVMSLYEVSDIVLDQSFLARDLLRGGEPVRVREKMATRSLKPWELIAARLVNMGKKIEMTGGVLSLRRDVGERALDNFFAVRETIREEVRELVRRKKGDAELGPEALDTEVLRVSAFLFISVWLEDVLRIALHPLQPTLINSDGETIVFMTVRYPLKPGADRQVLVEGLATVPGFLRAAEDRWDWVGPPATPVPAPASAGAARSVTFLPDGSVSLGSIELKGDTLTLQTNSPQRADRARALLDPAIGSLVGDPVVEAVTVEQARASRPAGRKPSRPDGMSAEEERAILNETLDRHYHGLLDQPVPALDDMSPRDAARTEDGREMLVDWLKGLENANAQHLPDSTIASYDLSWMWEELGVSDLRR
jgi:hypothetical protein